MKRRSASFARRPGSAASGVYRWKIRLTICTKQNRKVACRCGGFPDFFACREDYSPISLEKAARRLTAFFKHAADTVATTRIPESYTTETNNRQGLRQLLEDRNS